MKIALVTDAWHPQVNGVVRTLDTIITILREWGHEVLVISPDQYRSVAAPSYPEIRLAMTRASSVGRRIAEFEADAIHLATEGPLCLSARRWCRRNKRTFTTAYHTQFPEYLAKRTRLSPRIFWLYIRWFHGASKAIMVSTRNVRRQLITENLSQVHHWGRGVDLESFSPDAGVPELFNSFPKPIQLYVGRVAVEKNIEAFLNTDQPGSKVVVGDGPALNDLIKAYPEAHFLGRKSGRELAGCYAGADVFVFPSKTDTFGLVLIESLACGTPVAAFPVTGPVDILTEKSGTMDEDLNLAIAAAQKLRSGDCLERASHFDWVVSARQFLDGLDPMEPDRTVHLSRRLIAKATLAKT
ncbi:glycosyltransferase family 1 protein [Parasphingorhabdus litoris]|uniref:Glycosyltransferase family 1 protein n=1 Tax=Parasphingorhabdus litoris TaxID=394733 RepID=A0ABN1A4N4_9SPHN|nr:glycosyltransferase family 1 protein [Parasphingorhabdus litoris]